MHLVGRANRFQRDPSLAMVQVFVLLIWNCVFILIERLPQTGRFLCQGALTHGDRRATESRDLSRFNIDNKYGRNALDNVMKSIVEIDLPIANPPKTYKGDFFEDVKRPLEGVGMITIDHNSGACALDKGNMLFESQN